MDTALRPVKGKSLPVFSFVLTFLMMCLVNVGWGQGTETFNGICTSGCTPSASSYGSRSWTGTNGQSWSAADARTDQTITSNAITIRDGSITFGLTTSQKNAGIGNLTLNAKAPFGSPDVGTLQLVVNGNVISSKTTTGSTTSSVVSYTWSNVNVSTLTSIVINQTTTSARITIDDISWTAAPIGANPPSLTPASGATVDAPFDVTFTEDAAWRTAITSVTVNGTTLTAGYNKSNAGKITFTPSASAPANLLQTSGSKTIVISATGYTNATVTQSIGAGVANKLAISTQPTAPTTNGGTLATQPVVTIQDQYSNTTTSTLNINAVETSPQPWTLNGTKTVAAVNGTATFNNLAASYTSAYTGASITFTAVGLTPVTSNTFNIPAPAPANDLCANASLLLVNGSAIQGSMVGATNTSNTFAYGSSKNDVWYTFIPSTSGSHTITLAFTSATNRDIDFDIFTTASCPATGTADYIAHGSSATETVTGTFTGNQ